MFWICFSPTHTFLRSNIHILPGLSDHDVVSVEVALSPQRIKTPGKKMHLYNKSNYESIKDDINKFAETVTEEVINKSTVDQLRMNLKSVLISSVEKHIPSRLSKSSTQLPWVNYSQQNKIRRKQRSYNKAKRALIKSRTLMTLKTFVAPLTASSEKQDQNTCLK